MSIMSLTRAALSWRYFLPHLRQASSSSFRPGHLFPRPSPTILSSLASRPHTHLTRRLCAPAAPSDPPLEIYPLPSSVDPSRVGLYEILDSAEGDDGANAIFGVHGPREFWPGGGGSLEAAGGGAFAVIDLAGRQFKVVEGDTLYTNRIEGEVNEEHVFENIACLGTMLYTVFGRPFVPNARVVATIEGQMRSRKVMVTKFKKRKGYTRRKGHRQPITRFRILSVEFKAPEADRLKPYEVEVSPLMPPRPNNVRVF